MPLLVAVGVDAEDEDAPYAPGVLSAFLSEWVAHGVGAALDAGAAGEHGAAVWRGCDPPALVEDELGVACVESLELVLAARRVAVGLAPERVALEVECGDRPVDTAAAAAAVSHDGDGLRGAALGEDREVGGFAVVCEVLLPDEASVGVEPYSDRALLSVEGDQGIAPLGEISDRLGGDQAGQRLFPRGTRRRDVGGECSGDRYITTALPSQGLP